MSYDEGVEAFVTECSELLEEMESALLEWEENVGSGATDPDIINRIFRAMHTIKGSAGLFGFEEIISFTHVAESLMSEIRKGDIAVTSAIASCLIKCKDHVEQMVAALGGAPNPDPKETEEILVQLNGFLNKGGSSEGESQGSSMQTDFVQIQESTSNEKKYFDITYYLDENCFREGFDPASFMRGLKELGTCSNWMALVDRCPNLCDLEPDACFLGWSLRLVGDTNEDEIREVFEFSEGTQLQIQMSGDGAASTEQAVSNNSEEAQVESAPSVEINKPVDVPRQTDVVEAAEKEEKEGAKKQKTKTQPQIRVDAVKLDRLINLVGEMVTMQTEVARLADQTRRDDLIENVSGMNSILEEVRESALGLRMIAIGSTLEKFRRVVRDVSKQLDKKINLEIRGGETELDKAVIEQINDPLMHMLRNGMDHGIELPEERLAAGKPEAGTILLNAYHEAGAIVIEIVDDGKGLDKDRLMAKGLERGIFTLNQQLTDSEIYGVIFEAGFSTSQTISNLSGRGVGMDVVRRNIEALRGQIDVESVLGKGTRFIIRIPLTLSIIDGFLVRVKSEEYVVPLAAINECIAMERSEIVDRSDGHNLMNYRDEFLPLIYLDEFLMLNDSAQAMADGTAENSEANIVVVEFAGKRIGFVVDELLGEIQAVIKPLGRVFHGMKWVSGFTILGGGNVALIFDIPGLIKEATDQDAEKFHQDAMPNSLMTPVGGDSHGPALH